MAEAPQFDYVVVGGGIAGVTCAETLGAVDPEARVLLVSASPVVKSVANLRRVTKMLEEFDVQERPLEEFVRAASGSLRVLQARCTGLDAASRVVRLDSVGGVSGKGSDSDSELSVGFGELCICTGAAPKLIAADNPRVVGIRDTETVAELSRRLAGCRRLLVIGNGGIATELVYELRGVEVVWVVRQDSIGATFFDPGAAQFLLPRLTAAGQDERLPKPQVAKHHRFHTDPVADHQLSNQVHPPAPINQPMGSALGPDWSAGYDLCGAAADAASSAAAFSTRVIYSVEVARLLTPAEVRADEALGAAAEDDADKWPVWALLTNGEMVGADLIVSATGVTPSVAEFAEAGLVLDADGAVSVDLAMRSSLPHVFAAGDACGCGGWATAAPEDTRRWFQMRLWSQARQTGFFAARCMRACRLGEDPPQLDMCFELFTHVTRLFGFKVVLLGLYNAQGLSPGDYLALLRVTPGVEYVKCVMRDGRMQGCLLIGETDLEETFENLILNQLDLSHFGEHLLDPGVDIDDYFD